MKHDMVLSTKFSADSPKASKAIEKDVPLSLEYNNEEFRVSSEDNSSFYVQNKIPNNLPTDEEINSMDITVISMYNVFFINY